MKPTRRSLTYLILITFALALNTVISYAQGSPAPASGGLSAENIIAISAAVVGLTQMVKWAGLPDKWGPIVVLILSGIGVGFWGWSQGDLARTTAFTYFAGAISIALNAAGIFGFTRASVSAVTSATSPPAGGAGSSATSK